eukprot:NODE_14023_length_1133_cov_4.010934.p1 GENE.NODE_14023_length_1133_cov_4.010934~~NODE_14023_length_1133_cov_4.010934.p1  ORF type:complete len:327 (-),score=63.11 NODE_14023_length_1133_cov_4.010934:152-997(-)
MLSSLNRYLPQYDTTTLRRRTLALVPAPIGPWLRGEAPLFPPPLRDDEIHIDPTLTPRSAELARRRARRTFMDWRCDKETADDVLTRCKQLGENVTGTFEEKHNTALDIADPYLFVNPPPGIRRRQIRAWELCMLSHPEQGRPIDCITPCPTLMGRTVRRFGKKKMRLLMNGTVTKLQFRSDVEGREMVLDIWLSTVEAICPVFSMMNVFQQVAAVMSEWESERAIVITFVEHCLHKYVCFIEADVPAREEMLAALTEAWYWKREDMKVLTRKPRTGDMPP